MSLRRYHLGPAGQAIAVGEPNPTGIPTPVAPVDTSVTPEMLGAVAGAVALLGVMSYFLARQDPPEYQKRTPDRVRVVRRS